MCADGRPDVALWLKLTVRAASAARPEWPQLQTLRQKFLLHPRLRTRQTLEPDRTPQVSPCWVLRNDQSP